MPVTPKQRANLNVFSATNQPKYRPGRPKGVSLTTILKKALEKKINYEDPETQQLVNGKVKDAIVWRLILNACQGEHQAIREILDRIDGKVAEHIKVEDDTINEDLLFSGVPRKGDGNGRFKRFYN